jgi:hypothetical protein
MLVEGVGMMRSSRSWRSSGISEFETCLYVADDRVKLRLYRSLNAGFS